MDENSWEKTPLKAKNLKIIDHLGTNYATFDGEKIWKIEKEILNLLLECNGKQTTNELCEKLAKLVSVDVKKIQKGLRPILEELEDKGLISFV